MRSKRCCRSLSLIDGSGCWLSCRYQVSSKAFSSCVNVPSLYLAMSSFKRFLSISGLRYNWVFLCRLEPKKTQAYADKFHAGLDDFNGIADLLFYCFVRNPQIEGYFFVWLIPDAAAF